jgi:broad specificity phosphatase PhoE
MGMPNDLVLVRHGRSAGNEAVAAAENGDNRYYTDDFITTPGHQWRLTDDGRAQAAAIGLWIQQNIATYFDRYMVSPFVRAMETAGTMRLPDANWRINRALRERDWGDIGSIPYSEFRSRPECALNARMRDIDPLYWKPPGGESIAGVAEDRIRNICDTLHRETTGQTVLCVTHGEVITAFELVLERLHDNEFANITSARNCEAVHYSRRNPTTGLIHPTLAWKRRAYPHNTNGTWTVTAGDWTPVTFTTWTNDDLLRAVADIPTLAPPTTD